MRNPTRRSVHSSLGFLYEFLGSNYSRAELANLLDSSQSVISRKISLDRWDLSEVKEVFNNKGYEITFAISMKTWAMKVNEEDFVSVGSKYESVNLRFLKDFFVRYPIRTDELKEKCGLTLHSAIYNGFRRDDLKWSALLKLLTSLKANLRIEIMLRPKKSRGRQESSSDSSITILRHSMTTVDLEVCDSEDESL